MPTMVEQINSPAPAPRSEAVPAPVVITAPVVLPESRLLYGQPDPGPQQIRQKEQAWHRAAAYHLASGLSIKDTAAANGVHPNTVTALLKNDWFQRLVTELIATHGGQDVMALFKAEAMNSFATLVELRDDPKVSPKTRASISDSILDRGFGKAVQKIEQHSTVRSDDPVKECERLEAENQKMRESL